MSTCDVCVIGAGNGGLMAAATLARQGRSVVVLERHNIPGGCATSFCRGRFEFEVALHQLSGIGTAEKPGPVRMLLDEIGVASRLEFVPMDDLYRVVVPGRLDLTLKPDREQIIATLQEQFPEEKAGIQRFFDRVWQVFSEVLGAVYFKDPEASPEKYPAFFKYAMKTAEAVFDECFSDPLLRTAVSPYWTYYGLPPDRLAFADLAAVLFVYTEFLPYHIRGGSQALSNALAETILENGGEIRYNCAAERIIVENGRATGVVTAAGDTIAAHAVISNASKINTYVDMMSEDAIPAAAADEMRQATISQSAFTLYMGLDCPPEELGMKASTSFIIGDTDYRRVYEHMKQREIDSRDGMLLTCYDCIDDSFSPPGCCQAALITLKYGDDWLSVPPEAYADEKFRIADSMLTAAEKVHPGLREHMEEMEIATPLTHLRYLGHPRGAIYGFEPYLKDSPALLPNRSHIEGLFHTGGWYGSSGFQPTLESGAKIGHFVARSLSEGGKNR